MILPANKLTVLHDDNGSFTDHSESASDFIRDTFSATLSSTEDYLYVGYTKPFGAFYAEFSTPNTNSNSFAVEKWTGSAWESVSMTDESQGWTRSGFAFWDKSSMASSTVNSLDRYWIRIRPDADHSATTIRGINLVFADDNALKTEFFQIDSAVFYPGSETSHISIHVAVRNEIIQRLRGMGYITIDASNNKANLDQWDLLDIFEIRQAATYLALSKIFFNCSDQIDDHYWVKYKEYLRRFEATFPPPSLSIDTDNDGITDDDENVASVRVMRWRR